MNLEIIRTQTTWNDAAGSINSNYAKIADAIAQLKANGGGGGGGADIDLTDYATKVWVEAKGYITASALTPYAKTADVSTTYATIASIQGFENRIGGLEGAVPQLNERVTTVEGKVSSLNETVSTGENNLLDRVNVIEEEYATKTYVDNAIDGIDLSPYLKTEDAKETYATKDFVNNKLINYATIGSVTAIQNTLTGQIGAVGASVEQLAATKLDSSYFTLANIKSTLGISDWALAATKPSYAWSEITSRPTALSQFTDDLVAGKYLPLSGGTIVGKFDIKAGAGSSATIRFRPNNGAINHWLGVNSAGVLWFSNNGWSQQYNILHSDNIGNYNAGSATKLQTPHKLWGNDFDGTADVSGNLYSDIWRVIKDSTSNGIFIQSANYDGTSDLGNIYISARNDNKLTSFNVWANNSKFSNNIEVGGSINNVLNAQKGDSVTAYLHITNVYSTIDYVSIYVSNLDNSRKDRPLVLQNGYGNVGVGSSSPTEKLDVSGNIKASGNINATSITINGVTITASNGSITVNGNVIATGSITAKKSA